MTVDVATPTTLADLATLGRRRLAALHASGTCASPDVLRGEADGLVLTVPVVRGLRLWRGKVFTANATGPATGVNRLGIGTRELRRYPFEVRTARSRFSEREVLLLDHDRPGNPIYVRRFHDEVVQVGERLLLATSHFRVGARIVPVCYFALQLPA